MNDFEEIALSGGKIEFLKRNGGVSARYSHSANCKSALYEIRWVPDGDNIVIVGTVGFGGINQRPEAQTTGRRTAWVISDREGFFGRMCPECRTYFRTTRLGRVCPYCEYEADPLRFQTTNQVKFLKMFCRAFSEAFDNPDDVTIDLDDWIKQLPENRPQWVYSEERQQTLFTCTCRTNFDVLGEYVSCHVCGRTTWREVIDKKFSTIESRFEEAVEHLTDRQRREEEWEQKLTQCVSDFDAMARQVQKILLLLPATPSRLGQLRNLSFQNITRASDKLKNWYGIEMFKGISLDDQKFLNLMFNRRHLLTHNNGVVDQEYLDNTDDTKRLNEKIRIRSKHIRRLIPLVRAMSDNLINDFESMFPNEQQSTKQGKLDQAT